MNEISYDLLAEIEKVRRHIINATCSLPLEAPAHAHLIPAIAILNLIIDREHADKGSRSFS
jgi:hypothetical protein